VEKGIGKNVETDKPDVAVEEAGAADDIAAAGLSGDAAETDEVKAIKNSAAARNIMADPEARIKEIAAGELILQNPLKSGSAEHERISYDFGKLTGWDYVTAMDSDNSNTNNSRITNKQALCLFAAAVNKAQPTISMFDVQERLSMGDGMNGVRLASTFFVLSILAGNKRISNA